MDVKALSFSLKPYIERNGNSDMGLFCVSACVRRGGGVKEAMVALVSQAEHVYQWDTSVS